MTLLSFLLCFVALTDFSSITSYGYHMLPEQRDDKIPCLNDGFRNDTGSCVCKDSNYISGENCEEWKCINFGRGLARLDKNSQPFYVCDCPLGFRGPHCEATACIPNSDGFIKAFNPVERSFTIIITYNNDTQAVINRGDKIIVSITEMLKDSPFKKDIDRLHIVPIGSQTPDQFDCPYDPTSETALSDCFKDNMELYVDPDFYGPLTVYSLTTSDILAAIEDASTHSSILLISNLGLTDFDNTTQLNLISQSAIARQIEFNVLLIESSDAQGQNIFYNDKYKPLIKLAHRTLGTFINPYKIVGGPFVMSAQDIIPDFGKLIATKTLVDFGVWEGTGLSTFNVLLGDNEDPRDIYISVAANRPYSNNIDAQIQSAPDGLVNFDVSLDAGIWKLFKYSYSQTYNSYQILFQVSEACTYHIWTAPKSDNAPAQPHLFVGFLTDSVSDANYPIAVKGADQLTFPLEPIPNTVVAHLYNAGSSLQNIVATVSVGNDTNKNSSVSRPTQRNCLFNLQFTPIICGSPDDYGMVQIKVDGPSFFQETVPITCGTPEDTQHATLANDNALKKRFKNLKDEKSAEKSAGKDAYVCSHPPNTVLDPLAQKTFVLAFPNYKSLTDVLFNGLLNTKTIIKTLKDYYNSYDETFFTNFVLSPYVVVGSNTEPNVSISTNYLDFQQSLLNSRYYSIPNDPDPISLLNQEFVLDSLITFPQIAPFSEIFIITNKPYVPSNETDIKKNLADRRIKLNFLIYDDGSFQGFSDADRDLFSDFYDLAAHSGGNVVLMDAKQSIQDFFDKYQGMQKSQISVSSYHDAVFAGPESAGEFMYVTGSNYYIQAAVKYESGSEIPQVQLKRNSEQNAHNATFVAAIGKHYALFSVPNNTASGKYAVTLINFDIAPVFLVNVVEINPANSSYYVVGFVSDPTYDLQQTYPSFSGSDSRVFIVAKVENDNTSEVTISYPHNEVIYNGEAESRDTSCTYNLITSDYKWQCPVENQLYYIILETSTTTRTAMFPCYSSGGGDNTGGNCQNGGTVDSDGNCVCPPGYEGKNCGVPTCYNGGTIEKNATCSCPEYYTGPHCETATFSCQRDIPFPRFTSLLETLVVVVDLQISDLADYKNITVDNIPPIFQQYILVGAYQSNNEDEAIIQVYDTPTDFVNAMCKLAALAGTFPKDARFAIKRALQAVKTDRTLLIWLSSSQNRCGTDNNVPEPDDELLNLIAKRKVELRAFSDSTANECFQMIASYGNGVPLKYRAIKSVFDYINLLVPATVTDKNTQTDNLVVIDSYITDNCQDQYNITLAIDDFVFEDYKDLHVILFNLNDGSNLGPTNSPIPDVYTVKGNKFTLKKVTPSSSPYCGYIVEGRHTSRVAYEVTQSDNFEAEGYGVFYAADKTNLNVYFENGLQNIQSYNDFPEVFTANVEYTNFTYEHAPVIRRKCTYPWSVEIKCQGFNGALKTKLIMKDEQGDLHQRLITTYCIKRMSCSSYGTPLLADDKADDDGISRKVWTCGCNPLWSGTDCSIPVCLNGGTPNRESCNCPLESYGSNCEVRKSPNFDGNNFQRSILIILDVTGSEEQLESRKELLSQFLDMYKTLTSSTYYSFVTNIEGGETVDFTNDQSKIRDKINSSLLSNDTINLTQAFEYFNNQSNLWTNFKDIEANGIFYISDSRIDPAEDLTALFKLHDRGFYLYSAYYYANTDPSIPRLADLSGLGGTTGSWTTYDILVDFSKFLQGGNLSAVPSPPSTTTPRPIPCISKYPMDIVFVIDPVVSSYDYFTIFIQLRDMVSLDFSSDLKFATPDDVEGSRATVIIVNMSPGVLLCLTSADTLKNTAGNLRLLYEAGNTNVDLNQTFNLLNGYLSPSSPDHRVVPTFTIFITDRPDIQNLPDIVNSAKNMRNLTNFVVVGVGSGDFLSSYGQFANDGMYFNIPKFTTTAVSDLQQQLYSTMCSTAQNFNNNNYDADYICPAGKKTNNHYSFWT